MLSKFLDKKGRLSSKEDENNLRDFFDEIDAKQKEIAEKKKKIEEEHNLGSRITKHKFSL